LVIGFVVVLVGGIDGDEGFREGRPLFGQLDEAHDQVDAHFKDAVGQLQYFGAPEWGRGYLK
jgi:hypothetical protein